MDYKNAWSYHNQQRHRISSFCKKKKKSRLQTPGNKHSVLNARMYSQVHNSWKHGKPDKINQEKKPPKNVNTATHTPATMTNLQWSYVFLLQAISTGTKGKFRTSREKCGEKEDEFHVVEKAEFHVAAELQKSLAWDIMICYKITSIIKHHGSSFICLDRNEKHDQQGNKKSKCSILQ